MKILQVPLTANRLFGCPLAELASSGACLNTRKFEDYGCLPRRKWFPQALLQGGARSLARGSHPEPNSLKVVLSSIEGSRPQAERRKLEDSCAQLLQGEGIMGGTGHRRGHCDGTWPKAKRSFLSAVDDQGSDAKMLAFPSLLITTASSAESEQAHLVRY